jgi:hypothetical protein
MNKASGRQMWPAFIMVDAAYPFNQTEPLLEHLRQNEQGGMHSMQHHGGRQAMVERHSNKSHRL